MILGTDQRREAIFSYVPSEEQGSTDHLLRSSRDMVDAVLKEMSPRFTPLHAQVEEHRQTAFSNELVGYHHILLRIFIIELSYCSKVYASCLIDSSANHRISFEWHRPHLACSAALSGRCPTSSLLSPLAPIPAGRLSRSTMDLLDQVHKEVDDTAVNYGLLVSLTC